MIDFSYALFDFAVEIVYFVDVFLHVFKIIFEAVVLLKEGRIRKGRIF